MAIKLNTPVSIPDTQHQGVTNIEFLLPHELDLDTGMKIHRRGVNVIFHVTTWAGDGSELSRKRYSIPLKDWPSPFLSDVRDVYSKIEQYCISQNLIGDGVQEQLEQDPPEPDPPSPPGPDIP